MDKPLPKCAVFGLARTQPARDVLKAALGPNIPSDIVLMEICPDNKPRPRKVFPMSERDVVACLKALPKLSGRVDQEFGFFRQTNKPRQIKLVCPRQLAQAVGVTV